MSAVSDHLQALGLTLMHFCWQAVIIAGVYWQTDHALPNLRSQTRYIVTLGALLAMLVAAVATFGYEEVHMSAVSGVTSVPSGALVELAPPSDFRLSTLIPYLDIAWLLGVVALSARMLAGLWFIRQLKCAALTVPEALATRFRLALHRSRLTDKVMIRLHPAISGPFVVGAFRAVVYLPLSAITALSPEQLDALLSHELEHIRRADFVWNLVQSLIETLFFYHPVVWWIGSRLREQRELCCDDAAMQTCADPLTYATALLSLEEQRRAAPQLAMALNGQGNGSSLLSRIARILDEKNVAPRANRPKSLQTAALALPILLVMISAFATPVAHVAASTTHALLNPIRPESDAKVAALKLKNKAEETKSEKDNGATTINNGDEDSLASDDEESAATEMVETIEDSPRDVQTEASGGNSKKWQDNDWNFNWNFDADAISAQIKSGIEQAKIHLAHAKASHIDADAIAEQARKSALLAKEEMRKAGLVDASIDPNVIAAQARRDVLNAKMDVERVEVLNRIDADAMAAQVKEDVASAKSDYERNQSSYAREKAKNERDKANYDNDKDHNWRIAPAAPASPPEPAQPAAAPSAPEPAIAPEPALAPVAPLAPTARLAPLPLSRPPVKIKPAKVKLIFKDVVLMTGPDTKADVALNVTTSVSGQTNPDIRLLIVSPR